MREKKLIACFMSIFLIFAVIWGAEINKRNKQIYELDKRVKQLSSRAEETMEAHDDELYTISMSVTQLSAKQRELEKSQEEQVTGFQKQIDDVNVRMDKMTDTDAEKDDTSEAKTTTESEEATKEQAEVTTTYIVEETVEPQKPTASGSGLTAFSGIYWFGDQLETYYNLDMSVVVSVAQSKGISGDYWIREDGCKMLGSYIMIAANYDVHPYGSLVETSLGTGIVVDTGGFAAGNPTQVDIATSW